VNRLLAYFAKMTGGDTVPVLPPVSSVMLAGVGATIAIAAVVVLTNLTGSQFLMAPFGATCFLAFAVPDSPLAQPRNIVFGHLISTTVGLLVLNVLGAGGMPMAVAVGLSVVMMQLTRTGHPPAGADPLVVIATAPMWDFLIFPVLVGACAIALVAVIFNNLRNDVRYPRYW